MKVMGPSPSERHTLDRIDPFGDYTPENCKWSTYEEQNRNKRPLGTVTSSGALL